MRNQIFKIGAMALLFSFAVSCNDDDGSVVKLSDVKIQCNAPQDVKVTSITDIVVSMKNISKGETKEFKFESLSSPLVVQVEEGLYNVDLEAKISYVLNGANVESVIRGRKENVQLIGSIDVSLDTYFHSVKEGFVLAEICISGTLTPEGNQYSGDSYFRIYNNSSETLYADGLCLFETEFQTDMKNDYKPDIMSSAMSVATGWMIPGDGTQYPVAPGASLLICDNAINHKKINPNSYDLSGADFEWYAESSNPNFTDTDNPEVPNLIPIMKSSLTLWQPHMRGVKGYALANLGGSGKGITSESYLKDYYYDYTYMFIFGDYQTEMEGSAYMLPNSWVCDAVNMSPASGPQWLVTDPSLDKGYASVSATDFDENRYGKCARRKVDSSAGKKLQDTNDSSADFDSMVTADPYHKF